MNVGAIRKPLLIFCLIVSIALHVGAVWLLYFHPFVYETSADRVGIKPAPEPQIIPKEKEDLFVEKIEKALEESLNTVILAAKTGDTSYDIAEEVSVTEDDLPIETISSLPPKTLFASEPKVHKEELASIPKPPSEFFASMPPLFDPEVEASLVDFAFEEDFDDLFDFEHEKFASIDFSNPKISTSPPAAGQAIEDDYTMTDQQFSPSAMPTHSSQGLNVNFLASIQKLETHRMEFEEKSPQESLPIIVEPPTRNPLLSNSVDYLRSQWIKRSLAETHLPDLGHYGLETVETVEAAKAGWKDELDIDLAVMPSPEGNGKYVFSLMIHPEFEAQCQPMNQNFYFLIDRSSSIEKHKFSRFKRAVQRALAALHEGDNFNIYIFDKNVVKLSAKNLSVSPKTIEAAESFLEGQSEKTHLTGGEPYTSLEDILPTTFNNNELHSVILITDGNTLLNSTKQRRSIGSWTEKYHGNVNFYAAAAGKGNNLVLLDLLSYSTGGKMVYSETNAGFPRKLVRLVKDLHYPLVKNIAIEAQAHDESNVILYPNNNYLPPMFAGQQYIITGIIDKPGEFTFFFQGKNHAQHLSAQTMISLDEGVRGGRSLEKTWAMTQSKICYDHFLKSGKSTYLKEAVKIVAPYKGAIASEQ